MSTTATAVAGEPTLHTIVAALHAVDPAAFPVAPRVLRRVLRSEFELRTLWTRLPHRHSYVIPRDRLSGLVAPDELGIDDLAHLPDRVILVAMPEESEIEGLSVARIAAWFHRRLFHARVHVAFDDLQLAGRLTQAGFRERIDRVGQGEFDEARAVLRDEHILPPDSTIASDYVEFAAVWLELKHFAPQFLAKWFPSLADRDRVSEMLAEDVDGEALYEATRIVGSDGRGEEEDDPDDEWVEPSPPHKRWFWQRWFPRRAYRWRTRSARAVGNRGNDVRAAIRWKSAEPFARPEELAEVHSSVDALVDRLTTRLAAALEFGEEEAGRWREVLRGLVENSTRGFWNADARLLYDLQKVCLDHEREVSAVDLIGWVTSLGRRPIRRSLPNQREVLMAKHLSSAARRIPAVKLPGSLRRTLSELLEAAADSAEQQLRRRLKPIISEVLVDVGMTPANIPERVAFRKIVDELLDAVTRHGFLTMGDLRDAISRSNLKLHDLSDLREAITGDELLRADKALSYKLDGVYRRGEIYLRWLQRLSSIGFGTTIGRRLVMFFIIPYGGAYVVLEGVSHFLAHLFPEATGTGHRFLSATRHLFTAIGEQFTGAAEYSGTLSWLTLFVVGTAFLLLLHWRMFRAAVKAAFTSLFNVLRGIAYDFPQWVLKLHLVRALLRHPIMLMVRRWVVRPAMLTGLVWLALPWFGASERPGWLGTLPIFIALQVVLNSRAGRDIEELVTEQAERIWHRFRIHVLVALFDAIMEFFKRLLDFIEKLLYEVDEFLRFRSGEGVVTLVIKGVLGVVWAVVTFIVRFCVTLLIEPQVNPIKHFPVVTVSHKILLPLAFTRNLAVEPSPLAYLLMQIFPLSVGTANGVAATVVWGIPGIFGFLVWELRENWRLFAANRLPQLHPVIVGEGGETMPRLLKPGFHSGTVPKLFARRRRAMHDPNPEHRRKGELTFHHRLQHLRQSVERFFTRELIVLLEETRTFAPGELRVGNVTVGVNTLRVELVLGDAAAAANGVSGTSESAPLPAASDSAPLEIVFLEQSGWLVAQIRHSGWLEQLEPDQRERLAAALMGLYRMSGIDLIHEQIDASFGPRFGPYDIVEKDLIFWPGGKYDAEVRYHLLDHPVLRPKPRHFAETFLFPKIESDQLLFDETPIEWSDWCRTWAGADSSLADAVRSPLPGVTLLPRETS